MSSFHRWKPQFSILFLSKVIRNLRLVGNFWTILYIIFQEKPAVRAISNKIKNDHFYYFCFSAATPGRTLRAGSGKKALEIAGTWKQYSHRKFVGFFPIISNQFLPESTGNWLESTGKNPTNFRSEYCFHFRLFPVLFCRIRWLFHFFPAGSCGIQWP